MVPKYGGVNVTCCHCVEWVPGSHGRLATASGCLMGATEAALSGDKQPPEPVQVSRRIASAVSGSLSGTLIGSLVQVCATKPVRRETGIIAMLH